LDYICERGYAFQDGAITWGNNMLKAVKHLKEGELIHLCTDDARVVQSWLE
jgi:hypothetical protein